MPFVSNKKLLALALLCFAGRLAAQSTPTAGALQRDTFTSIPGYMLTDLRASTAFRNGTYSSRSLIYSAEAPTNAANSFGQRLRGWITAPTSGDYTFYISSCYNGELWLGTTASKFSKTLIAEVPYLTALRTWTTYPSQTSATITLVAGQSYYLEALAKDHASSEHLSIGWKTPSATAIAVIPAQYLSSYVATAEDANDDDIPDAWVAQYGLTASNRAPMADPDGDGVPNWMEYVAGTSPVAASTNGTTPDSSGLRGFLSRDVWTGISGSPVASLTSSAKFLLAPNFRDYTTSAESRYGYAESFGERLRGTVIAPVSGQYTFLISGDDTCELWLSSNAHKFERTRIAAANSWTNFRSWTQFASQSSVPVTLVAGQEYYIEILHKEGAGSDHVSVGWSYPGQTTQVIPGAALRSYTIDPNDKDDDGLPDDWEVAMGLNPNDNGSANSRDGSYSDSDHDNIDNLSEYQTGGDPLHRGLNFGLFKYERWLLSGAQGKVSELTTSGALGGTPDFSGYVKIAEIPQNAAESYGARLRGMVTAPVTGSYQFAIASDNDGELWLSDNESPFGKHRIASLSGYTTYRNFTAKPSQLSAPVALVAGRKYYIEGLVVENVGEDHLSIAWKLLNQPAQTALSSLSVIGTQYISVNTFNPLDLDDDSLPDAWEIAQGLDPNNSTGNNGEYGNPDGDSLTNLQEYQLGSSPMVAGGVEGNLARQFWYNIAGSTVHDFISNPRFLQDPDLFGIIPGAEAIKDFGDNYGQRLRGLVRAPVTGTYIFSLAGDESVELWLSRDDRKFLKQRIAAISTEETASVGVTSYREWTKFPSQRSWAIQLTAGQEYFLEILHKEIGGSDSASVAWEYTNSATGQFTALQPVPVSALTAYGRDAGDLDDDYLPDSWELSYGLAANDNGSGNARNGEQGDPDSDGLTNQQEFQLGTNPVLADTDGDGVSDYDEIYVFGSNPLVADIQLGSSIANLAGSATSAASSGWHAIDDVILVSTARRGWVEYAFTTVTAGRALFHLHGCARGAGSALVKMPLIAEIDGAALGSYSLRCGEVTAGVVTGMLPWLKPGSHVLRIRSENVVGNLSLQINSVDIQAFAGTDANNNGTADWLDALLARDNDISRAGDSAVSPLCLEGHAAFPSLVRLSTGGAPAVTPADSVQNHWYQNIALNQNQPAVINVQFEDGAYELSTTVRWLPTNLLQSQPLTIRRGDSLRLTAYPGTTPDAAAAVQITIGTAVTNTTADAPLVQQFDNAGTFTVAATHTLNGTVTHGSVQVKVMAADFGPDFPIYYGRPRLWTLPDVPAVAVIEPDPRVSLLVKSATSGKAFLAAATQTGDLHVLARLPGDGAVLARGTLGMIGVASTAITADTSVVYTYANGDKLVRMGVVADNLPPGGYVQLDISAGGVTFQDGTRTLILHASDFDDNGVAYVVFNYPAGTSTSVCHKLYVYDANGVLIGTR